MFITILPWRWLGRPIDRSIKSFQECTNLTLRLSMLRSFLVKTCTMSSAMSLISIEAGGCREDLDEALGIIVTAHPSYKFSPQLPLLTMCLVWRHCHYCEGCGFQWHHGKYLENRRNPGNWCNLRRFVTTTWQLFRFPNLPSLSSFFSPFFHVNFLEPTGKRLGLKISLYYILFYFIYCKGYTCF